MLRIELSAQDLTRIRFAPQPAPLVELKLALMMLRRPDSEQTFGRWRRGLRQRLPATTRPLWDLLTPYRGPAFLDPLSTDLPTGLETVRSAPTALVRAGVERVWAGRTCSDGPGPRRRPAFPCTTPTRSARAPRIRPQDRSVLLKGTIGFRSVAATVGATTALVRAGVERVWAGRKGPVPRG
ncbi:hypothetical protein AB5J72_17685 [Streptomyces sp. CG1]|uniref:hypothetical protein n=1 Tax=Streptomyces sp. CG1 TaxID=1287523 RepID=UPI0034E2E50A